MIIDIVVIPIKYYSRMILLNHLEIQVEKIVIQMSKLYFQIISKLKLIIRI